MQCVWSKTCSSNQVLVILGSHHFSGALRGWIGGEAVWANSTRRALDNLGYTYVFAASNEHAVFLYKMFPSLVIAILMEADALDNCWADKWNCVKSGTNPDGIPIWKILAFYFWMDPRGPLGAQWTLSPEPYGIGDNVYLGYNIENTCKSQNILPPHAREHRAYVMTKFLRFFKELHRRAWPPEFYADAVHTLGVRLVASIKYDEALDGSKLDFDEVLPRGVERLQQLGPMEFAEELMKSKVLIGIGQPEHSPTPYVALCVGIPFINPVNDADSNVGPQCQWDHGNPKDRSRWQAQHWPLRTLDPPYVYNVFRDDREGFLNAIRAALENPIDSFIPEHMRMRAVEARLKDILEKDYYALAESILRRRRAGIEGGEVGSAFCFPYDVH
ncbi:hypothetical protein K488DRAFT_75693 [Vararia minispora EC-137]|uniref:Uncharacterized protein n=1 Tax=Vararia minispora EC-137 TaxID=1314806 RepID=A0ACB8QYI8_9AGAM|nr:hypothetical protein K488DRAFT_75693 [Vararia minispora EC-137]